FAQAPGRTPARTGRVHGGSGPPPIMRVLREPRAPGPGCGARKPATLLLLALREDPLELLGLVRLGLEGLLGLLELGLGGLDLGRELAFALRGLTGLL